MCLRSYLAKHWDSNLIFWLILPHWIRPNCDKESKDLHFLNIHFPLSVGTPSVTTPFHDILFSSNASSRWVYLDLVDASESKIGEKVPKRRGSLHYRDYQRTDLLPVFFKGLYSLFFKVLFLRVHSQGPGELIRIQSPLSAERQFTCGSSSDMLLLIHVKGSEGEQHSLIFASGLTGAH